MSRRGTIQPVKEPNSGFYIDEIGLKRPLSEAVEAVDGKSIFTGCGLGLAFCSEIPPCSLHHEFKTIHNRLMDLLEQQVLLNLAKVPIEKSLKFKFNLASWIYLTKHPIHTNKASAAASFK